MSKTFNGAIKFPSNFDVQATRPLDDRLVVDSHDDLTNGSIAYPYQGMVVNIKGTSELWILKTQGVEESHHKENWELVTGSGSGGDVEQIIQEVWDRLGLTESDIDNIKENIGDFLTSSDLEGYITESDIEDVRKDINNVKESLGTVTALVGDPGTENDEPTGIFGEIDELKKIKSSTITEYSMPIMTPAQRIAALSDPNSGFKDDTDYIAVDLGESDYDLESPEGRKQFIASIDQNYSSLTGETANKTITSVNGTYLDIMMSAIKALQAEVTELRQVLAGGLHSYINKNTAKSATLYNYDKVATDEPLWSLNAEDGGLTEVLSTDVFN